MKRTALSLVMIAIAASTTVALIAAENEKKQSKHEGSEKHQSAEKHEASEAIIIKIDQAPTAVQAAIKQVAGSATVIQVEKETEDGIILYEAGWKVGDVEHEVVVSKHGDVMVKEMAVGTDAVPETVRKAAMKHLPKGAKAQFELMNVTLYEIEAMVDGKEIELLIDPSGRLIEFEADDDHDDDDHDDDDDEDEEHEDKD